MCSSVKEETKDDALTHASAKVSTIVLHVGVTLGSPRAQSLETEGPFAILYCCRRVSSSQQGSLL